MLLTGLHKNSCQRDDSKQWNKALSFYASRMHEKAVWKYAAREYGLNGYSLRVANIARADENQ